MNATYDTMAEREGLWQALKGETTRFQVDTASMLLGDVAGVKDELPAEQCAALVDDWLDDESVCLELTETAKERIIELAQQYVLQRRLEGRKVLS
jgi:hypothetical protein